MCEKELNFINESCKDLNLLGATTCTIISDNGIEDGIIITVGELKGCLTNKELHSTAEVKTVVLTTKHVSKILKIVKEYSE